MYLHSPLLRENSQPSQAVMRDRDKKTLQKLVIVDILSVLTLNVDAVVTNLLLAQLKVMDALYTKLRC